MVKNISFEEELIKTIELMAKINSVEDIESFYKALCETVAIKHLKSKGICNMPYIGEILYYTYDYESKEYRSDRESIPFSKSDYNML